MQLYSDMDLRVTTCPVRLPCSELAFLGSQTDCSYCVLKLGEGN